MPSIGKIIRSTSFFDLRYTEKHQNVESNKQRAEWSQLHNLKRTVSFTDVKNFWLYWNAGQHQNGFPTVVRYGDLCHKCQTAVSRTSVGSYDNPDWDEEGAQLTHYPGFRALQLASFQCSLCRIFLETIYQKSVDLKFDHHDWMATGTEISITLNLPPCSYNKTDKKDLAGMRMIPQEMGPVSYLLLKDGGLNYFSELYIIEQWPEKHLLTISAGNVTKRAIWSRKQSVRFSERLPVIYEWIEKCTKDHSVCIERRRFHRMPTRLVDIHGGIYGGARIVETASLEDRIVKYTTLSHRWGTTLSDMFKSTKGNIDQFMCDIPIQFIPKTFWDAFKITNAIGIRYIWIDTLCIIQSSDNDPGDLENEITRMCDIYNGSFLNIAANDALSCDGGCFLESLEPSLHIVDTPDKFDIHFRRHSADMEDVLTSPLNQRGWVFQEITLAPRNLFCGSKQFYWQCQTCSASEDGLLHQEQPLSYDAGRWEQSDPEDMLSTWRDWASSYVLKDFTFDTDRIVAMAGVTNFYKRKIGMNPVLGLWEEAFAESLLWYTAAGSIESNDPGMSQDVGLRVPSWTWLSRKYCILESWRETDSYPRSLDLIEIRSLEVKWTKQPLTSEIKSTRLVVKGSLGLLEIYHNPNFGDDGRGWSVAHDTCQLSKIRFDHDRWNFHEYGASFVAYLLVQHIPRRQNLKTPGCFNHMLDPDFNPTVAYSWERPESQRSKHEVPSNVEYNKSDNDLGIGSVNENPDAVDNDRDSESSKLGLYWDIHDASSFKYFLVIQRVKRRRRSKLPAWQRVGSGRMCECCFNLETFEAEIDLV